jgi:hypothetical protein
VTLRDELHDAQLPDESEAMERSRRVVLAAHARRAPRSRAPRFALAVAGAAAALAVALTPPGSAVADWVGDVVRPGADEAAPVLDALPARGRLLVDAPSGPWVVQADGSKRRLGSYASASWSPQGLYLVAVRDRELFALEPDGDVRWSLAGRAPVAGARWAPNGLRIAYLSGDSLRLVDGDGAPDEELAARAGRVAPAWRASGPQELAYVDSAGRVRVIEPESGAVRWRGSDGPAPVQLAWTADGRRLLARSANELRVYRADGRLLRTLRMRTMAAAWAPDGAQMAVARPAAGGRSEVVLLRVRGPARRMFSGGGRFTSLAWSPDGRWLAIAWRDAGQWLFIRSAGVDRIEAVGGVARQFGSGGVQGFPELVDWCC